MVELICFNNIANPISAPSVRRFEKIIESTRRYDTDVVPRFTLYESSETCNLYQYIECVQRTTQRCLSPCTSPAERTLSVFYKIANVSAVNPRLYVRAFAGRESYVTIITSSYTRSGVVKCRIRLLPSNVCAFERAHAERLCSDARKVNWRLRCGQELS